ncbi:hypothetical protein ACFXG4_34235 [Nocardia sp. NPDC059246]|uniref:hypothetical protein n=1 Tax=unclassified Nocardia TaxID=2637762 RepID=UPI0036AD6B7A
MNSAAPSPNSSRPPIPARLHDAPTAQGLAIPFLTLCHRGQTSPVWGAIDPERYALVLSLRLCQVCGERLGSGHGPGQQVVVFVRPQDWVRGVGPEAGLHQVRRLLHPRLSDAGRAHAHVSIQRDRRPHHTLP